MSKTALRRAGAKLAQPEAAPAPAKPRALTPAERRAAFALFCVEAAPEAADLPAPMTAAELEAAFAMFGVKPEQEAVFLLPADAAYRVGGPAREAANEDAPAPRAPFPALKPRSLHIESRHAIRGIVALDWVVVVLAAELAALWGAGAGLLDLSIGHAAAFILGALSLKAGLWLTDVYRTTPARVRAERGAGGLALGAILGLAVANFIAPDARGAGALAAIIPAAAMTLAALHAALAVLIRAAHRKGVFSETIVLVGATSAATRFATRAAKNGETRIIAVVDDRLGRAPGRVAKAPVCGNLDDLMNWDGLPHVDRIVITVTQKAEARVRAMIERLRIAPNRIDLLLDYHADDVSGRQLDRAAGAALVCVSGRPRDAGRLILKRAQDLIIGSALLAVFAPVMLAIAIAVRLDSKGPSLYRQKRHGFNNRIIHVLKFRSMLHDPDAKLRQVQKHDPRVTRLGAFLRRTSLDELPQLINVLKGEMSLVGPRPHAVGMRAAKRDLTHIVAEYAHRHRVKPGITGWAQIHGSRGPIETPALVRQRVKYDLDYVARASLWLDLLILIRTAPALLGDRVATR